MKVLHTADIHLREYGDERWLTLQELVDIGRKEKIGLFAISGDLFNEGINAENLRPKIRELFSDNDFPIVLIPGNHDANSYAPGQYFGKDTHVIRDIEQPFEQGEVRVWGIPFEEIESNALLSKLRSLETKLMSDKVNILLYHGELLSTFFSFSRFDLGDEGVERYMPVKLEYFDNLNIQYVLAGHFHTKFEVLTLWNGWYFIYPGSPIAITSREVGQRKVNLFEVGKPPNEYLLDTPHYQELIIRLDPFDNKSPVKKLADCLVDLHPEAMIILSILGYVSGEAIGMNEVELKKEVDAISTTKKVVKLNYEVSDIRQILEDDLFKRFMTKLEQLEVTPEKKIEMRDIAIKAMIEVRQ